MFLWRKKGIKLRIQHLTEDDLAHVHMIDVSETGTVIYRYADGILQTSTEQWERPRWSPEAWQQHLQRWIADLHPDLFLGAFVDEQLVGLVSLRYQ